MMRKRPGPAVLAAFFIFGLAAPSPADELSIEDLGFQQAQIQSDPAMQKVFDRRSRMLKTHQLLGLITAVPMAASLFSGEKGSSESSSHTRNLHAGLGKATAGLYFTTAGFSIFAPEIDEGKKSGATKLHVALAWVHFPAMVATTILGYKAEKQLDRGEEIHGSAKLKPTVAGIAAGAYLAAGLIMTVNLKFGKKE